MTNLISWQRSIEADGRDDDLVVVLPWYCATTFARYYRGAAPWIAFPDVHFTESARPHRQVAERMTRGEAGVRPELDRIERTLRAGVGYGSWVSRSCRRPDRPRRRYRRRRAAPTGGSSVPISKGGRFSSVR